MAICSQLMSSRLLLIQARANRLMNHRLHAAVASLSPAEFVAPRVGFFPSLHATLNHILVVDRYYVDAFVQGGLGLRAFDDETPCATIVELARAQSEVDHRLVAFCASLTDADLGRPVGCDRGARGVVADRVDRTLLHVFMHQTHHRGQVHAMLSGSSVAPPPLDEFFMQGDAARRADELVACGYTEADLAPWLAPPRSASERQPVTTAAETTSGHRTSPRCLTPSGRSSAFRRLRLRAGGHRRARTVGVALHPAPASSTSAPAHPSRVLGAPRPTTSDGSRVIRSLRRIRSTRRLSCAGPSSRMRRPGEVGFTAE